jgi:hypothetical protein
MAAKTALYTVHNDDFGILDIAETKNESRSTVDLPEWLVRKYHNSLAAVDKVEDQIMAYLKETKQSFPGMDRVG